MAIKIEPPRCFQAVAEHGSLAVAATALGRTPSAVSMMLAHFEDHIGTVLFQTARKSCFMPLGRSDLGRAPSEVGHFDRTNAAIEELSQAKLGLVRLAVTRSVAQVILRLVLQRFMGYHPNIQISLFDMDSAAVAEELRQDSADIGIASIASSLSFRRQRLFSDPVREVCRSDHPLTQNWDTLNRADREWADFIANGFC
ncbi:MAG: LysR family transcriptional regulator [Paracoccaceae bacterium]|nr:LysR family transcriptional regulator [Paracoccaceae bacterium]